MIQAKAQQPAEAHDIAVGLTDAFLSFDSEWRIVECNPAAERIVRCPREKLQGRNFWRVSGVAAHSPLGILCHRVARTRRNEEAEMALPARLGGRLMLVTVFPVGAGVAAFCRDITEQRRAETAMAESATWYRGLADDSPAASWVSDAQGRIEFVNQAMADTLGRPRQDLLGDGWMQSIDPDETEGLLAARENARRSHSPMRYEGHFHHSDGSRRVIELYARPRFNHRGEFVGHLGTAADVTDLRDFQRRQQLIVNELNHRVKNTLVSIQSVVAQTLRECKVPREANDLVSERLAAYAVAHDLVTRESWEGVELSEIVRTALASYGSSRVMIVGEPAWLDPNVALAVAMAMHELVTNAAKYGALSTAGGRVLITWAPGDRKVVLNWRECGGLPVKEPSRTGFGMRLLGGLVADLGAPAKVNFSPAGLHCAIDVPVKEAPPPVDLRKYGTEGMARRG
jgi:PAS domain S-box-containing protein